MIEKRNFYINGSWVPPKNPKDIEVINPATEKKCAVISLGSKEDINDAVLAAKEALLEETTIPILFSSIRLACHPL